MLTSPALRLQDKTFLLNIWMDNQEADWAATGVFSPSKARAAQVQAKDWAAVDGWLAKKYARVPPFERNDETLQALLVLIAHNEAADERRQAVQRVQRLAVQHLNKQTAQNDDLIKIIKSGFNEDDVARLQTLSKLTIALDSNAKDGGSSLLSSAIQLSNNVFSAQQQEAAAQQQLETLQAEHRRLSGLIQDLSSDSMRPSDATIEETAEWTRSAKHLRAKIAEYDERLAASKPSQPMQGILAELMKTSRSIEGARKELAGRLSQQPASPVL